MKRFANDEERRKYNAEMNRAYRARKKAGESARVDRKRVFTRTPLTKMPPDTPAETLAVKTIWIEVGLNERLKALAKAQAGPPLQLDEIQIVNDALRVFLDAMEAQFKE